MVSRDLVRGDGQQRLTFLNLLALMDMNGPDGALAECVNLLGAGGRREISKHRFLAGILRYRQENEDRKDGEAARKQASCPALAVVGRAVVVAVRKEGGPLGRKRSRERTSSP